MNNQTILQIILLAVIFLFLILLILITKNISQQKKIYSFRSEDKIWDAWRAQFFGLIIFVSGFIIFVILFFGYTLISHPEYFGLATTMFVILHSPFENVIFLLNSFIGLIIGITGVFISIKSINEFITNIKRARGEKA